jgi:hypothetical protein
MLIAMTARALKPGAYDEFIRAWIGDPEEVVRHMDGDAPGRRWRQAYTARRVGDHDQIMSFGFFDGTIEQLHASQRQMGYAEGRARADAWVEDVVMDGLYEVSQVVDWAELTRSAARH